MIFQLIHKNFIIMFSFILVFITNCKKDTNPLCWGSKKEGTLYDKIGCHSVLYLDDNPNEGMGVINSVPKKFLNKDGVRVSVKYKEVDKPQAIPAICTIYDHYIKIICIEKI